MTFVVCILLLSVLICYVFLLLHKKTYNNNKKNGRRLKTKNSFYLNFQCFRYHLCGKLKFDVFPPGVTQVKGFFLGEGAGGIVSM